MIGQWSASYLTKQILELETEPIRIAFHIAAEMITLPVLTRVSTSYVASSWFSICLV